MAETDKEKRKRLSAEAVAQRPPVDQGPLDVYRKLREQQAARVATWSPWHQMLYRIFTLNGLLDK